MGQKNMFFSPSPFILFGREVRYQHQLHHHTPFPLPAALFTELYADLYWKQLRVPHHKANRIVGTRPGNRAGILRTHAHES